MFRLHIHKSVMFLGMWETDMDLIEMVDTDKETMMMMMMMMMKCC
jgi:alpha-galactosidase